MEKRGASQAGRPEAEIIPDEPDTASTVVGTFRFEYLTSVRILRHRSITVIIFEKWAFKYNS